MHNTIHRIAPNPAESTGAGREKGQAIFSALPQADSDRFLLANVVYQGRAAGLDPDLLWPMGDVSTKGLMPHLTIVLDMPAEAQQFKARFKNSRIEIIPAEGSIEEIHAEICKVVGDCLEEQTDA